MKCSSGLITRSDSNYMHRSGLMFFCTCTSMRPVYGVQNRLYQSYFPQLIFGPSFNLVRILIQGRGVINFRRLLFFGIPKNCQILSLLFFGGGGTGGEGGSCGNCKVFSLLYPFLKVYVSHILTQFYSFASRIVAS